MVARWAHNSEVESPILSAATMAKFELYTPILKKLEGGFVNHPADEGGITNCGVTLATFRAAFGKDKTADDLKNMTDKQWKQIMKVYWDSCKADQINNQSVANLVVDWSINSGVSGRKGTQTALKLYADGIFGPKTLAALNAEPAKCVFCKILEARKEFYKKLVERKPSQMVFYKGWLNRLSNFSFDS